MNYMKIHSRSPHLATIRATIFALLLVLGAAFPAGAASVPPSIATAATAATTATWNSDASGTAQSLLGVTCLTAAYCKAVGFNGTILTWDGASWSPDSSGTSEALGGIDCFDTQLCKATGDAGTIVSWDGTNWSADASGTTETVWAVGCPTATLCKASNNTTNLSWDGSSWSTDAAASDLYRDISCPTASHCKAMGIIFITTWDAGTWDDGYFYFDGIPFHGIGCASATFCKAVGENGAILSWDGMAWTEDSSGTTEKLNKVACSSATACKAVGTAGTILSWDGMAWSADTSGTTVELTGISCWADGACKAVGANGTILSIGGATAGPTLTISTDSVQVANDLTFNIPVNLALNGNEIPTVGFSIDYDESCVLFDETDADSDGLYDAVQNVPAGFTAEASHSATDSDGELDLAIFYFGSPSVSLGDGVLVELGFQAKPACVTTDGTLVELAFNFSNDPAPEFAGLDGGDVPGTSEDAVIPLQFNSAPTDITLSAATIAENLPAATIVGSLTTADSDGADTHAYTLTGGDVADFAIAGSDLKSNTSFNYEVKASYTISITTDDGVSGSFEKAFTITVDDANDAPVAVDDLESAPGVPIIVVGGGGAAIDVLANDTDEDAADTLTVNTVTNGTQGTVANNGTAVTYTPTDAAFNGADSFTYVATDDGTPSQLSNDATVNVAIVANDPRGDCNTSGSVGVPDITSIILEYFDGDSNSAWWQIYQSGFLGSPRGCEANNDSQIGFGDISCTVLIFFGDDSCTQSNLAAAANGTAAQLAVAANPTADPGDSVQIPIHLTGNGHEVVAAGFTLNFDVTQLSFDATDANEDGIPDAIAFDVPAGMTTYANYNSDLNRVEIAVYSFNIAAPPLNDGLLATIELQVRTDADAASTELNLDDGSLGNGEGQDVPVDVTDGTITINDESRTATESIFLPFVQR